MRIWRSRRLAAVSTGRYGRNPRGGPRAMCRRTRLCACCCLFTIAALIGTACQRGSDYVATTGSPERSSRNNAVSSAHQSDRVGDEEQTPLCSEIDLPIGEESQQADGYFQTLEDPASVGESHRKLAAVYLPPGTSRPDALTIIQSGGSSSPSVHTVPLGPSVELHPSLLTSSRVGDIVISPDRWFVPVTVTTFMDLDELVQKHPDFASQHIDYDWVEPDWYGERGDGGVVVRRLDGLSADGTGAPYECFISWEELGTTGELFDTYGSYNYGNDPYPRIRSQVSGFIWTARWGDAPTRADLPNNQGRCCRVEILDTGYVAISDVTQDGSHNNLSAAPPIHYSSDGVSWSKVDVPTRLFSDYMGIDPWEIRIWVCSVQSTDTGVLIRQALGGVIWEPFCGEGTYWSADENLTNWRKLLAPPPGSG